MGRVPGVGVARERQISAARSCGPWAESVRPWAGPHDLQKVSLFVLLIPEACLICFLSKFWANFIQFFPKQNYPTKFCFREHKSDRNASEKYKAHEILFHVFPLQIDKCAPFKFKRIKS